MDTRLPESAALPESLGESRAEERPDSGPAVLADLIAAGLVSHEMIGDPAALASEAEALQTLCAQVLGPVWRLDPFHYAFRARPEDLGGQLAAIAPEG